MEHEVKHWLFKPELFDTFNKPIESGPFKYFQCCDITPIAGYTDDLGVLVAASAAVASHIKKEHGEKAREKLSQWFR